MSYLAKNNAYSTLAAGISSGATSLTVQAGHGDRFPVLAAQNWTKITLEDAAGNREVIKAELRTAGSDVIGTLTRGQEGTTARAWNTGDVVELRMTAQLVEEAMGHSAATSAAHAASAISVTPTGGIASTDVQAALAELDSEKLSTASEQVQAATRFTAGGTADAITGTLAPAITGYTAGLRVTTTPPGANTLTGPTINLSSLGTKTTKKRDSSGSKVALAAGDYNASGPFDFEYDGMDFILLNPIGVSVPIGVYVPTGMMAYFPSLTAPTGWIKRNGALLSRTTYAALWSFAQASGNISATDGAWQAGMFSPGDGATTFRIPDGRGEFVRGLDDGRGVDSGRGIGTAQSHDFLSHYHYGAAYQNGGSAGSYAASAGGSFIANVATTSVGGTETRPRNVAALACIKY